MRCLYYLRTKNKLDSHKKVRENKDFCDVVIPSEETNLLEFNQYHESDKKAFVIYADLESLIEKMDRCRNNPEKSSTTKVGEHVP